MTLRRGEVQRARHPRQREQRRRQRALPRRRAERGVPERRRVRRVPGRSGSPTTSPTARPIRSRPTRRSGRSTRRGRSCRARRTSRRRTPRRSRSSSRCGTSSSSRSRPFPTSPAGPSSTSSDDRPDGLRLQRPRLRVRPVAAALAPRQTRSGFLMVRHRGPRRLTTTGSSHRRRELSRRGRASRAGSDHDSRRADRRRRRSDTVTSMQTTWPVTESAMSRGKEKNMRQVRWASWMVGLAMALAVCGVRPAAADIRSDQAAAILEWPSVIFVEEDFIFGSRVRSSIRSSS